MGVSSNDIQMTYEYNEYLRKMKKFNPRYGEPFYKPGIVYFLKNLYFFTQ